MKLTEKQLRSIVKSVINENETHDQKMNALLDDLIDLSAKLQDLDDGSKLVNTARFHFNKTLEALEKWTALGTDIKVPYNDLKTRCLNLVSSEGFWSAVYLHRNVTGSTLKEAKDIIKFWLEEEKRRRK